MTSAAAETVRGGMETIDLFAGAGGWDIAAHALGIEPIGIELDPAACATRRAARLLTVQADITTLDPRDFDIAGLIASPPCQAFSPAGDGLGRAAIHAYLDAITEWRFGRAPNRARLDEHCQDARAHLVLEPIRWAIAARPEWITLEQVETVLPIWEAIAAALRDIGYSAWTGVLSAEQYGVAQTRRRAILIASRVRRIARPPATHQAYVAPRRRDTTDARLFDVPDPERIVRPEDHGLEPWVSMAAAISRGMTARPYPAIACSRDTERLYAEQAAGRWTLRAGAQENATERTLGEPAPTVAFGHDAASHRWVHDRPSPTIVTGRRSSAGGLVGRQLPEGEGTNVGGHGYHDGPQHAGQAVRVTVDEAAILQSFPAGYPWQGTKTQRFRQIGNAVPPLLAEHVLREATGR